MFVHDFAHIELPYPAVHAEVLRDGSRWMCALGCAAYAEGAVLQLRVGPGPSHRLPSKMVHIYLETPHEHQDSVSIPMRWVASGVSGLFPSMAADLDFAPLGQSTTQVTLSGMYDPPLGLVGRTVDALLLHRVAEATIRSFVRQVTAAIETQVGRDGSRARFGDPATSVERADPAPA